MWEKGQTGRQILLFLDRPFDTFPQTTKIISRFTELFGNFTSESGVGTTIDATERIGKSPFGARTRDAE